MGKLEKELRLHLKEIIGSSFKKLFENWYDNYVEILEVRNKDQKGYHFKNNLAEFIECECLENLDKKVSF